MNKILIISPGVWGNLPVSKHNYAIELAKQGNLVYFMNPPNQNGVTKNYKIAPIEGFKNLFLIDFYLPKFRIIDFMRFRLGITQILDYFILKLVTKICRKENLSFSKIWNFDPNLHGYFSSYPGNKKIFFIADQIQLTTQARTAKKADAVISVANEILEKFFPINKNCLLINHGMNKYYEEVARKELKVLNQENIKAVKNNRIQVGYIGNLLISYLDEKNLQRIVTENPNVDFHFWGAYNNKNIHLLNRNDESIYNTIHWIKDNCTNTTFYGAKHANEIIQEVAKIDVFIYVNSSVKDVNGGANSHKILEYLSTGKVIVSTYLSYYFNQTLFPMTGKGEEDDYTALFSTVINNLEQYNNREEQIKRITYALENTYEKNIQKINQFIQ